MIVKHFYEQIIGINVYFVYEYKPEEALKKLKRLKAITKDTEWEDLGFQKNHDELGKTVEYIKDGIVRYIVFVRGRWYDTVVHETIHLVNMLFSYRGIKADFNNDEYYAYYVSYWYKLFEKILSK